MEDVAPKVSIIVPVYNVEQYIQQCIESISNQTFADFEILLIDDGSTDNSEKICDEYATRDNRIRVFHKENGGVSSARNLGIEESIGEYICFVDSDDTLPEDSLSLLIERATKYNLDITLGVWNWISIKYPKRIIPLGTNGILSSLEFTRALLNEEIYSGPVGRLYKRSLFSNGLLDTPFRLTNNEDLIMNLKLGVNSTRIGVFDDIIVYNYFERHQSASKKKLDLSYWIKLYDYLTKILEDTGLLNNIKQDLVRFKLRGIYYKISRKEITLDYSNTEFSKIIVEASMNQLRLSEKIMIKALTQKHFFSIYNFIYKCTNIPQMIRKLIVIIHKI